MIKYNPLSGKFDLVKSLKIGSAISGGTDGYILFSDAGKLAEDSGLFWDNVNKRLGIGIIPESTLHIEGDVNFGTDSDFSWNDSGRGLSLGETNGAFLSITHPEYDSVLHLKTLDDSWNYISFYNSTARTGFFGMDITGNNFTFAPYSGNTQVQSSLYVKTNLSVGTKDEDERVSIRGNCKFNGVGDKLMYPNGHIVGMQVSPNKGILYDAKGTTGGWYGSHLFYTNYNGADTSLAMIIKDKKVGIRTLTPDANIQVVGDAKIGEDTVNYLEVGTTGDISMNGSADTIDTIDHDLKIDCGALKTVELVEVVYKDINLGASQLSRPTSSQPDLVTFVDEAGTDTNIQTYGFAPGEKVHGSFEIQHDYKEGTDIEFHVHWQGITAPTGTDKVKWQLTYTLGASGQTLDAPTTIVIETDFDTQYEFKLSEFSAITGTNISMGEQFLFTLERITASADEYAGDALIATAGLHYQIDTIGSRQKLTK